MDSYSLQLFSDWNELFSTEIKLARKEVEVRQDSLMGTDFAEMQIHARTSTAGGTVFIGPDEFRHANYLTNDLDAIKLKGSFFLGDHTLTVGYEREMLDIFNLFVPRSQGQYLFRTPWMAWQRGQRHREFPEPHGAAAELQRTHSRMMPNDGAATFGYDVDRFYVQDEWQVTPDFKLQAGVRLDKFSGSDKPLLNSNFAARYGFIEPVNAGRPRPRHAAHRLQLAVAARDDDLRRLGPVRRRHAERLDLEQLLE